MKRGYYLITFKRGDENKTIINNNTHPLIFLKTEKEIGNKTSILFYKELTEEEYEYSVGDYVI